MTFCGMRRMRRIGLPLAWAREIASMFAGKGFDFEVQELRGNPVRPASFDDEE